MKDFILLILALVALYSVGVMTGLHVVSSPVVQAAEGDAKEADPVVVPCKKINTLTEGEFILSIFLCKPENAAPYKLNTLGFMLPENP